MYKKTIAVLILSVSLCACENPTDTTNAETPTTPTATVTGSEVVLNTSGSELANPVDCQSCCWVNPFAAVECLEDGCRGMCREAQRRSEHRFGNQSDWQGSGKIVNWLVQRYEAQPPSGGFWIISKIEANADGEDFDVSILTTNEHAGMIMQMPPEAQFKVVSVAACPEASEDIWGMLEKNQRIILHVGGTGGVFIDVDCRKWI
ncbi:MAG: hypothetical protein ACYCZA_12315 [Thiobacillus sp.]